MREGPEKEAVLVEGIEGMEIEGIPEEASTEALVKAENEENAQSDQEKTVLEKADPQEALVQEEASMEGSEGIQAAGKKADFPVGRIIKSY